jgi:molecular chaperone DnaK
MLCPMIKRAFYVGFDLGTTNSAAAVFDGERTTVVRNAQGSTLTPSVVRIDAQGRATVGAKARRFAERDSRNTATEFKRLMGTGEQIEFPAAGLRRTPQQLAAEILRSLRADVRDQFGVEPRRAVVSVPALFELAQSAATTEAAKLAGLETVELIQEPIASALAAGWSPDEGDAHWLVYDLGGGTFDVSLLQASDGFLRVVGHDGDNFLGGRDFDSALVDWAIERVTRKQGVELSRSDPSHASAIQQLKRAAEETKIELSRSDEAALVPAVPLDGLDLDIELVIARAELERLCIPLVDRSIDVCLGLLREHGVDPAMLRKIVFVGGPTLMPIVRRRVSERLGAPAAEGLDPMTLVAEGAAIYAATAGLDARGPVDLAVSGQRLWLQYPPVSTDVQPFVVGRTVGEATRTIVAVTLTRADGWRSPEATLDAEGSFAVQVELEPARSNAYTIEARAEDGAVVPVHPSEISIFQGVTITDPPLSRSIGIALANDRVCVYFERGTPLPARCTFTHTTVETVAAGTEGTVLRVPIVQGEHDTAHLCRLVGTLEIPASAVRASLPVGSDIEVTLELDRGGGLTARALIPALEQVFEQVATLLVPTADPHALAVHLEQLRDRLAELRTSGFRDQNAAVVTALERADARVAEVERDLAAALGGDSDAGQRARRGLIDLDAELEAAEQAKHWPELDERATQRAAWANSWVASFGTEAERRMLDDTLVRLEDARRRKDVRDVQRHLRVVNRVGETAWLRDPDTWPGLFEQAASEVHNARDLPRAQALVKDGREAVARGDTAAIQSATRGLWKLLPDDPTTRRLGFHSGVR